MGCIEFFQDHVNFYDVEKYAQNKNEPLYA